MFIKKVLAPVDGGDGDAAALECAYLVASRFESHVEVLHVRDDARDAIPYMTGGISASLVDMVVTEAEKAVAQRALKARERFDAFCARHGLPVAEEPGGKAPSAAWREETGHRIDRLLRRGRLADLVVIARPVEESPAPVLLEAALFEAGGPILVAPPEPPAGLGRRVVLGWDGGTEAARAVADAMPFLADADAVTILTASDGAEPRSDPGDVVAHLAWHGIAASGRVFDREGGSVGEALIGEAQALDADLLVVGGYGHSRVRELVMGGVTRHLLAAAGIPILMSH